MGLETEGEVRIMASIMLLKAALTFYNLMIFLIDRLNYLGYNLMRRCKPVRLPVLLQQASPLHVMS